MSRYVVPMVVGAGAAGVDRLVHNRHSTKRKENANDGRRKARLSSRHSSDDDWEHDYWNTSDDDDFMSDSRRPIRKPGRSDPYGVEDHDPVIIEERYFPNNEEYWGPLPSAFLRDYTYKELRRGRIRLLNLHPSLDDHADLHCTLFHVDPVKSQGTYEAISYTWGFPEDLQTLYIHSEHREVVYPISKDPPPSRSKANYIKITPNLHSALRRFRDRHVGRILWVDAVCINQGDRNEKSDQIPLMQEIFANARRVLIWLGDAGDEGGLCLNFFRRLDESFRRPADSIPPVIVDRVIGDCLQEVFRHRRLDPLERFFHPVNRPWFLRRWVIQEVAPSPNGLLFCGPHQPIHWDQFSTAVNLLNQHPSRINQAALTTVSAIGQLKEMKDSFFPILFLLAEFHESDCFEGKDRIKSLIGLSTERMFKSSYYQEADKMSTEQFFFDFTTDTLRGSNQCLEVLHCGAAFQPSGGDARKRRYSYVPEWRVPPLFAPLLNVAKFGAGCAGGERPQSRLVHTNLGRALGVQGYEFSRVRFRSESTGFKILGLENIHRQIPYWIPDATWYVDGYPDIYQTFDGIEPYWEAFSRTLIADHGLSLSIRSRLKGIKSRTEGEEEFKDIRDGFRDIARFSEEMRTFVREADRPYPVNKAAPGERVSYSHNARRYARLVIKTMGRPDGFAGRCFFLADNPRYMGIGPEKIRNGDRIVIFYGARTPFIVRPIRTHPPYFRLIGDCYIHGIMNGESIGGHPATEQEFLII